MGETPGSESEAPPEASHREGDAYLGVILDSRYRLAMKLGQGGMGAVYLAEHIRLAKPIAIKFLDCRKLGLGEGKARLFREAQAAAAIGHPNIIDVFDVGISPRGDPYLAMEYLAGEDLSRYLERNAPLSVSAACAVLEPILLALHAAHAKNIIHRDLKPGNIYLVKRDAAEATIKLIDFGIAKFINAEAGLTVDGALLGTPLYMSPEQAKGSSDVDARSDLYAIGVVFYEMLTGKLPFDGSNYNEIIHRIVNDNAREVTSNGHAVPEDARSFIQQALAKDADERFQSAAEMLEALEALAAWDGRTSAFATMQHHIRALPRRTVDASQAGVAEFAQPAQIPPSPGLAPTRSVGSVDPGGAVTRAEGGAPAAPTLSSAPEGLRQLEPSDAPPPSSRLLRDDTRRPPRRGLLMPVAIFLAGIALALFAFPERKPVLDIVASSGPRPTAQSERPLGDNVQLTLESLPDDASVFYDGKPVADNPFRVPRGTSLTALRVEAPGFMPFSATVMPSRDLTLRVALVPSESSTKNSAPRPASPSQANLRETDPIESAPPAAVPAPSAGALRKSGRDSLYSESFE